MFITWRAVAIRTLIAIGVGVIGVWGYLVPLPDWARPAVFAIYEMVPSFLFSAVYFHLPFSKWVLVESVLRFALFVLVLSHLPTIAIVAGRRALELIARNRSDWALLAIWGCLGVSIGALSGAFAWAHGGCGPRALWFVSLAAIAAGFAFPLLRCWAREQLLRAHSRSAGAA
jgi:hypothetical protein